MRKIRKGNKEVEIVEEAIEKGIENKEEKIK